MCMCIYIYIYIYIYTYVSLFIYIYISTINGIIQNRIIMMYQIVVIMDTAKNT